MKRQLPVRRAILNRRTYEAPAEGRQNKVRLDFNENTAGCSPAVRRALAKLSTRQLAMYPEYEERARRVAKYFGVRTDELLLTNGGDEALRVFFDTFVDAGSCVVICEPTFPMYRYYAEISGARIHALRSGANMEFPVADAVAALQNKPRVLFIANPNNPTGTLVGHADLERIVRAAKATVIVIDEAYAEFSNLTVLPWLRKYPHLFVTRTFSKAAGLAGLRLGAVLAAKDSLAMLRRAMPPYPVNIAALVAAEAAIRDVRALEKYVRNITRAREWVQDKLQRMGVTCYPSAGNFVLVDFGPSGPALFKRLARKGILVRARNEIGPGFARITIGTEPEMKKFICETEAYWRRGDRG
jgi:histidinol-phosphate aminotransferase